MPSPHACSNRRTGLPCSSIPLAAMARETASSSENVAKAKPFDRVVSLSNMTVASITCPNCERNSLSPSDVTLGARPPTKTFAVRSCSARGMARLGSIWRKLSRQTRVKGEVRQARRVTTPTHLFPVQVVCPLEHFAYAGRAAICQESETTRSSGRVPHDDARVDFTVLRHVRP